MNVKQIVSIYNAWINSLKVKHKDNDILICDINEFDSYEIAINLFLVQQGLRPGYLISCPLEVGLPPKLEGLTYYQDKGPQLPENRYSVNYIFMLTSDPKGLPFQRFLDQASGRRDIPGISVYTGECLGYLYPSDRLLKCKDVVHWCCRSIDDNLVTILWGERLPKEYETPKIRAREIELNEVMKTEGFIIKALINPTKEELKEYY